MGDAQKLCHEIAVSEHPLDDWMRACGITTDNAAAHTLRVHRNTIANMRDRDLTHVELLALSAAYHRIKPWSRTP